MAKKSTKPKRPIRRKVGGAPARLSNNGEKQKHWTFLTNHSHVLILLHRNPEMVLREVAHHVGITERAVQRIVQDLEEDGFVVRERVGRHNRYEVATDQPLRHPIEAHRNIGDILKILAS